MLDVVIYRFILYVRVEFLNKYDWFYLLGFGWFKIDYNWLSFILIFVGNDVFFFSFILYWFSLEKFYCSIIFKDW